MTNINKTIFKKLSGPTRFNPDERTSILETYEAGSMHWQEEGTRYTWSSIRQSLIFARSTFILFWSRSPALDESSQLQSYLKKTKDLGLVKASFPDDCHLNSAHLFSSSIPGSSIWNFTNRRVSSIQIYLKRKKRLLVQKKNHFETSLS